jgi:hypothetical protein
MKINVEVDCTPEEARRFMGLPDLTPVHDAYVTQLADAAKNGLSADALAAMMQSWAPMGDAGMKLWQQMMEGMSGKKP